MSDKTTVEYIGADLRVTGATVHGETHYFPTDKDGKVTAKELTLRHGLAVVLATGEPSAWRIKTASADAGEGGRAVQKNVEPKKS
jgi:hypothetical protein